MSLGNLTNYNKTEESIFTLLSLTIQITQSYDSIYDNEDILNSNFEMGISTYHDLMDDTIYDALASQIILKTVAFLDEWNNYFGVRTEPEHLDLILTVKKIAKPAYDCIKDWKDLENYRNHVLAHNHRDKKRKQNVFLNSLKYNIPASAGELRLLCFCVHKMSQVVSTFFQKEVNLLIETLNDRTQMRNMDDEEESVSEVIEKLKYVDSIITDEINRVSEAFFDGTI